MLLNIATYIMVCLVFIDWFDERLPLPSDEFVYVVGWVGLISVLLDYFFINKKK